MNQVATVGLLALLASGCAAARKPLPEVRTVVLGPRGYLSRCYGALPLDNLDQTVHLRWILQDHFQKHTTKSGAERPCSKSRRRARPIWKRAANCG